MPEQQEVTAPSAEEAITHCDLMLKANTVCLTFAYYSSVVEYSGVGPVMFWIVYSLISCQ